MRINIRKTIIITSLIVLSTNQIFFKNQKLKPQYITLGSTMPISGGLEKLGKDLSHGISIAFNRANNNNEIKNHILDFSVFNDNYNDVETKRNIHKVIRKTPIFLSPFGVNFLKLIPKKALNDLLILFPNTSSSLFRSSKYSSIFFYRPSIKKEIEILIDYAINTLQSQRISVFHEDSEWGLEGLNSVKDYLNKNKSNSKLVSSGSYSRNSVNIKDAIKKIGKKPPEKTPDTIICISHYRATYNFIKELSATGFYKSNFLSTSESSLIQKDLLSSRGINLTTTSQVPNPWNDKSKIAEEYRSTIKQNYPGYEISLFSFEGYITASIIIDLLKNINPPITKEKIRESIRKIQNLNFKGLDLNWDNETLSLSQDIWLNRGPNSIWKKY